MIFPWNQTARAPTETTTTLSESAPTAESLYKQIKVFTDVFLCSVTHTWFLFRHAEA